MEVPGLKSSLLLRLLLRGMVLGTTARFLVNKA